MDAPDKSNAQVYNDLRNNVGMPSLTLGMSDECRPSIDRVSARDIRIAFNRIVRRIITNGGVVQTYDSRLQWPCVLAEIDGRDYGPGSADTGKVADAVVFSCDKCGREREGLRWRPLECCGEQMRVVAELVRD